MDMDYKDKYLRTFSENQKLKKERNAHLDQIKRKNTEIRQLKEDFKVRLARQLGVPRTSSGGKTQPLLGTVHLSAFFYVLFFAIACSHPYVWQLLFVYDPLVILAILSC